MSLAVGRVPRDMACKPSSAARSWRAQGPWTDLALHTLGWKAFQDLCAQVCQEVLRRPVEVYREAQDDGQDAVFVSPFRRGAPDEHIATVQCKFSAKSERRLKLSELTREVDSIKALIAEGTC